MKVQFYTLNTVTRTAEPDGDAVLTPDGIVFRGLSDRLVEMILEGLPSGDEIVTPKEGEKFMRVMAAYFRGSYCWAELIEE